MKNRNRQAGFTLIELMTVVTLAAVLAAVAIPSYKYATTSNRVSAEINGLMNDIQFARYEAIKEGLPVTICPAASATATTCDTAAANWSEGWIVLSNSADANASAVLRRQVPFSTFNSSDTLNGTIAGTAQTSLMFNREGFATVASGSPPTYALPAGTLMFSLHDPTSNASFTRCLMVSTAGSTNTALSGKTVYSTTCS